MENLEVSDEPTHATISAYVPIELRDRINAAAKAGDTTASRWVTRAIEERLARLAAFPPMDASRAGSADASAPRATRQAATSTSTEMTRKAAVERHAAAARSGKSGPTAREVTTIPKGGTK